MVEELIADYIVTKTSLVKATDLFLGGLPGGTSYGVAIQTHTDTSRFGSLTFALITFVLYYQTYTSGKLMSESIRNGMLDKLGAEDGTFATLDPVTINNYGTDTLGRNLFAVTCQVSYNAATI